MKLQDLKVGELYKCALSGEKVLVILTEPQKSQDPKTKNQLSHLLKLVNQLLD